jgi:hypothetical protein
VNGQVIVVAETLPVVRGDDDQRVVEQALGTQGFEQAADLAIGVLDLLAVAHANFGDVEALLEVQVQLRGADGFRAVDERKRRRQP